MEKTNAEAIISKIYIIRGKKVMIDRDLAELYGVETYQLKWQVRRNIERFPAEFMFELTEKEFQGAPLAFTGRGVAMLSNVLNSDIAIKVSIQLVRIYVKMRELLTDKVTLADLERLEKEFVQNEEDIQRIFTALKNLSNRPNIPEERSI